ncbi:glycosyltransferase [Flaviflexus huanghaiensis]|uniref:glycosyltransferase n=1 Tax=Flaviflexus huanghaiensis TaxID=1111473 RepID=UPI0015F976B3|nr:glycosyltransferase [Flaviflexus huanghaiensis]
METAKSDSATKRILYVGYYDTPENRGEMRGSVPAATDKMDYIMDVLTELGYEVEIVSASITRGTTRRPGKVTEVRPGVYLRLFPSLRWGNKFRRVTSVLYGKWQVFSFLVRGAKRGENVIVYHSLGYNILVEIAHLIRGFRLILEIEEIYADQTRKSRRTRWAERVSISRADGYLYSTDLLERTVNKKKRPRVVVHGNYRVSNGNGVKAEEEITRVVYAGVIDSIKGSFRVVEAAQFLPSEYRLHIIGFGDKDSIKMLRQRISDSNKCSQCKISFDGLLRGVEYEEYLQACKIGIVGQSGDSSFANTSFPSKILSYMANGLTVVCDRFDAVETSALGDALVYTSGDSAEELARAIIFAASHTRDSRQILMELNTRFLTELRDLLTEATTDSR